MRKWNFGIIGAGVIADFHARAINDIPQARLVGFCDGGSGRAAELAQKYACSRFANYDQMVHSGDVDIVTIATPSGFHLEPSVAAAKAGKHVICEKPLDVTLERVDTMIEAHRNAGTRLGGVFQNRFVDAVAPLKKAIDAERFGTVTYAGAYIPWWRPDDYYKDSWHGTWRLDGGGALMNQGIHMVDLLCYLAGPVESVQAFTEKRGHQQIETEDTSVAALRFTSGALGVIYGTTASYPGQLKRFEITGTRGTVVYLEDSFPVWQFEEENDEDHKIRRCFSRTQTTGGASDPAAIPYQNHTRNFQAFVDALERGKEFCLNGEQARKAVEVVLAVYKSAAEERIVKLG